MLGLVLATLFTRTLGITVAEGSPCKSACPGGDTGPKDLICSDSGYNTTDGGETMQNCLLCQSNSATFNNETDNDLFWFLCMDDPLFL